MYDKGNKPYKEDGAKDREKEESGTIDGRSLDLTPSWTNPSEGTGVGV